METPHNNPLLLGLFLVVAVALGLLIGRQTAPYQENPKDRKRLHRLDIVVDSLKNTIALRNQQIDILQRQDGVKVEQQERLQVEILSLRRDLKARQAAIDTMSDNELSLKVKKRYEVHN